MPDHAAKGDTNINGDLRKEALPYPISSSTRSAWIGLGDFACILLLAILVIAGLPRGMAL